MCKIKDLMFTKIAKTLATHFLINKIKNEFVFPLLIRAMMREIESERARGGTPTLGAPTPQLV